MIRKTNNDDPADSNNDPIIILGCPKSGTTLLRLILDSHENISCGPETSFLGDMRTIVDKHWSHLELYGLEREYWIAKIRKFYQDFQNDYLARRGKKRWAEKTPIYTEYPEFLLELFPNAQFIHIIRDGRDVVASMRDRHGWMGAFRGTKYWRQYILSARTLQAKLPKERFFELRYESLVTDPEVVTQEVFQFLQEQWDESILKYDQYDHDIRPTFQQYNNERLKNKDWNGEIIFKHRIGAWKRIKNIPLMVVFYALNRTFLKELGYR